MNDGISVHHIVAVCFIGAVVYIAIGAVLAWWLLP